jgi:hypothetical protein
MVRSAGNARASRTMATRAALPGNRAAAVPPVTDVAPRHLSLVSVSHRRGALHAHFAENTGWIQRTAVIGRVIASHARSAPRTRSTSIQPPPLVHNKQKQVTVVIGGTASQVFALSRPQQPEIKAQIASFNFTNALISMLASSVLGIGAIGKVSS